jgi:hypothetical protein
LQLELGRSPHPSRPGAVMILVLGVWAFVRALLGSSAAVTLENVAPRHQLAVLQRSGGRPPAPSVGPARLGRALTAVGGLGVWWPSHRSPGSITVTPASPDRGGPAGQPSSARATRHAANWTGQSALQSPAVIRATINAMCTWFGTFAPSVRRSQRLAYEVF